ncbi:unnamed protein product, partial [Ascophyllum nodosum]
NNWRYKNRDRNGRHSNNCNARSAPCSMTPPSPLRSRTASAAGPSRSTASPPALTAASADTSPVSLRAVSHSGETRHRGLRP